MKVFNIVVLKIVLLSCAVVLAAPVSTVLAAGNPEGAPAAQVKQAPTHKAAKQASAAKPVKPAAHPRTPTRNTARKDKARKEADAIATPVPPVKLDLSLPKTMVDKLQPPGKPAQTPPANDSLLPEMFAEKKPESKDFQLGGRILSNEMQLPMVRSDGRHDIDGAALDFKFKQ